ncbi:anhydro-N-acetylmuramic acid kinase [Adhaeribacter rhizoryzae]|uniref:Anhydro-N-acetylmuramic acid kinase n=1 Tax=Adhaeribacter rhizoryzae TaxID=2607907 RepID=A0A5M6D135_9BACT|nr:anhydro-N-acetylmuramic acid kinase [Adhaeribacter rhizoryzae]KAA5541184.1 anhydro-N-acetylmuramic acid kinase [Adhaeribacter rhizoryzae]
MSNSLEHLYQISKKNKRVIIGLMSGTSLDGLDIALCAVEGSGLNTQLKLLQFNTVPYTDDLKHKIKNIFSKRQVDLEQVCILNAYLGSFHADLILKSLLQWNIRPAEVDLIASHGQTIYHAPAALHGLPGWPNATLQIGDGDHLAVKTGIITVSDFRQKHIAAGGEGAPLAVYGDYLLFSQNGQDRIMLNIGGIANYTYLPGDLDAKRVFSTDVGPGNTIMDAYMQHQFRDKYYDKDGELAASGTYNQELVAALLDNEFFRQPFPKTTGPELFNLEYLKTAQQTANCQNLSAANIMASLNRFSAVGIATAIRETIKGGTGAIYISGGGMHNRLLQQNLQELLPQFTLSPLTELGVNPDAKEAVLFAVLANECIANQNLDLDFGNPKIPTIRLGKISLPD